MILDRNKSMQDSDFRDFVLDQLAPPQAGRVGLSDMRAKRMFGGFGLYSGKKFFGIIHSDVLYFKTNEHTRKRYIDDGSKPFQPNPKQTLKNYYEVPVDVLEDRELLLKYAEEAIRIATSG